MKNVRWLILLPPIFAILVADIMLAIYYISWIDAFVIMALIALVIGTGISLFLNEWKFKDLLSKPVLVFGGASIGWFVGLEFYNAIDWMPFWPVFLTAAIGATIPFFTQLQARAGWNKNKTKDAADKTPKPTKLADEQNLFLKLAKEFVAFIGGGNLFYGGIGLFVILGLSMLYWSYVDLTTPGFSIYLILLGLSLLGARLITYRQKAETTEPKKEGKVEAPDKKSDKDE